MSPMDKVLASAGPTLAPYQDTTITPCVATLISHFRRPRRWPWGL